MRFVIQRRTDMLVVSYVILTFDGKGWDFIYVDQSGSHVILRGERIGSGQNQVRPAGNERTRQVGSFSSHMQARR